MKHEEQADLLLAALHRAGADKMAHEDRADLLLASLRWLGGDGKRRVVLDHFAAVEREARNEALELAATQADDLVTTFAEVEKAGLPNAQAACDAARDIADAIRALKDDA